MKGDSLQHSFPPRGLRPAAWLVIALLALALWPVLDGRVGGLRADRVKLRNGRVVRGRVVSQTSDAIRLKTGRRMRVIYKRNIREITYERNRTTRARRKVSRARRVKRGSRRARSRSAARALKPAGRTGVPAAERKTALGALWRSALLPGWGQYYGDRSRRGVRLGSAFLAGAFFMNRYARDYRDAAGDYSQASTNFLVFSPAGQALLGRPSAPKLDAIAFAATSSALASTREARNRTRLRNRLSTTLVLGLYGWNLYDAYFQFGRESTRRLAITPGDGLRVSFQIAF